MPSKILLKNFLKAQNPLRVVHLIRKLAKKNHFLDYTRVFVEPIDVPLEADSSILLSTIQSSIPGAHGLYYRENGSKIGLR